MMYRTTACFTGLLLIAGTMAVGASTAAALSASSTATQVLDLVSGQPWSNSETTGASAADTATVTGVPGVTPTGSVSYALYPNGSCSGTPASKGTRNLSSGLVANSDSIGPLLPGAYSFRATYTGDANYGNSTSPCEPFTVSIGPSTTTSGVEDSASGLSWTNTETTGASAVDAATVTGAPGVTPTGSVTYAFYKNGTCSGSPTTQSSGGLTAGVPATSTPTGALSPGTYAFQATYSGDGNYHVSTASCDAFTVAPGAAPTATSVEDASTGQAWAATEVTGAAALDSARVTGVSGFIPSGAVSYTLYAGATCSGTVLAQSSGPLSGGTVGNSASSSALAAGLYSFQATYSGDTNYTLTNASCEPFTVAKAPSAIAAAVEPAPGSQPLPLGSQATASATITGVAGFTPTGSVTFNLYPVGDCSGAPTQTSTATLNTGVATSAPTAALPAGTYGYQASYAGDGNYLTSAAPCLAFTVAPSTSAITAAIQDAGTNQPWTGQEAPGATAAAAATVATVAGLTPTGSVTFNFYPVGDCTGAPTQTSTATLTAGAATSAPTAALPGGTYSYQASYAGDGNYLTSTAPCLAFTVAPSTSATTIAIQDAGTNQPWTGHEAPGATAAAAATVATINAFTPTGTVTFNFYPVGDCTGAPTQTSTATLTTGVATSRPHRSPARRDLQLPGQLRRRRQLPDVDGALPGLHGAAFHLGHHYRDPGRRHQPALDGPGSPRRHRRRRRHRRHHQRLDPHRNRHLELLPRRRVHRSALADQHRHPHRRRGHLRPHRSPARRDP